MECEVCGKDSNCGFTTLKDAREDVEDIWICDSCFLKYFDDDFFLFREPIVSVTNDDDNQIVLDRFW
jgi:formate dehydrogenase maturation protein FdhE